MHTANFFYKTWKIQTISIHVLNLFAAAAKNCSRCQGVIEGKISLMSIASTTSITSELLLFVIFFTI